VTISLVLVDDWELRGDGSGDMRRIQFDSMRQLNSIYEAHGLRGSYNAEIMQQLHHLRLGDRHPELKDLAQEWEAIVLETYERGHDVQLHMHSQWNGASYEAGRWRLPGDWSIINYPRSEIERMISECKTYLETLLRRVDPNYRCQSWRSGAWAIAPNDHILTVLAEQGIVLDMSICSGIKYDNAVIKLDYTSCDEPMLPYYPDMKDARRVADAEAPIICAPTFTFVPSRRSIWAKDMQLITNRISSLLFERRAQKTGRSTEQRARDQYQVWQEEAGLKAKLMRRLQPDIAIADLSTLSYPMMRDMIGAIRRDAKRRRVSHTPVILENHTKDIVNFDDIRRFAEYIIKQSDIDVITLKETADRLSAGTYAVRKMKDLVQ
jgi:hypothetical protein